MPHRALLIGINDYPYVNQLRGCLNDVQGMTELLTNTFNFAPDSIHTLSDAEATKERILSEARDWLFRDAQPGDRLVFHFSGHGSQVDDPKDPTGQDEVLCLYDIDADRMDSHTYLSDKELGELFSAAPEGAQLVIVFDSCHSGSGTRTLSADVSRALGFTGKSRPLVLHSSPVVTADQARHLVGNEAAQTETLSSQRLVRYVQPNARVLDQIKKHRGVGQPYNSFAQRVQDAMHQARHSAPTESQRELKQLIESPFDYLFYAACRSNQTAADATINGAPHGAFTYYLTQALTSLGADCDRRDLDQHVEHDLTPYNQLPQLESRLTSGPIFPTSETSDDGGVPPSDTSVGRFDPGTFPTEALRSFGLALGQLVSWAQQGEGGRDLRLGFGFPRNVTDKTLVTVHGITTHPPGYSNPWWDALGSFVPSLQPGDLGGKRQEVVWSDIVNARGLTQSRNEGSSAAVARQIKEILKDRSNRDLDAANPPRTAADRTADPKQRSIDGARATRDLSIPNIGGIDDFVNYLINPSIRQRVLDRFFNVVRPLLQAGHDVELISHSWGTVVAYEGLLRTLVKITCLGYVELIYCRHHAGFDQHPPDRHQVSRPFRAHGRADVSAVGRRRGDGLRLGRRACGEPGDRHVAAHHPQGAGRTGRA